MAARRPIAAIALAAVTYLLAGLGLARVANHAATEQGRTAWRLLAWGISVVTFAAHIWYCQRRPGGRPRTTAWQAALAPALAALGLAAAAWLHSRALAPGDRPAIASALVIWPLMTAIPAFPVALAAAAFLARRRRE